MTDPDHEPKEKFRCFKLFISGVWQQQKDLVIFILLW